MFMKNNVHNKSSNKKLEQEEIHIINSIEMLETLTEAFERILEDEMNNFIDNTKALARMREVNPEADLVRHHSW
jgi:hypothetical protein